MQAFVYLMVSIKECNRKISGACHSFVLSLDYVGCYTSVHLL